MVAPATVAAQGFDPGCAPGCPGSNEPVQPLCHRVPGAFGNGEKDAESASPLLVLLKHGCPRYDLPPPGIPHPAGKNNSPDNENTIQWIT